jgi:hypothetical protein
MGGAEAIWGGRQRSICCFDGHRWTRWPNSALPPSLLRSHGAWVLSVRGRKGFGREREARGRKVHNVGGDRDGGLTLIFDVGCSTPFFSVKKYGGGMMLVCY